MLLNILGRGSDQGTHAHYGYIVTIATKQLDRGNSCLGEPEMYKLDIRVDAKEAAATERRRSLEQQRQARIFNARERTIGVRRTHTHTHTYTHIHTHTHTYTQHLNMSLYIIGRRRLSRAASEREKTKRTGREAET